MQQPQPQEKTNVNHEQVNSEPTAQSDPYDDALAFKSLLTAVHGEFNHMVNDNMVENTANLNRINGAQILEKGVKEIMGHQRPENQIPEQIQHQIEQPLPPQPAQQQPPPPQLIPQPQPEPVVLEDPNQLQLDFDRSATVTEIFDKLENLETKINKILKLLEKPTVTKKKTVVKK